MAELWMSFASIWNMGQNPAWLLLRIDVGGAKGVIFVSRGITVVSTSFSREGHSELDASAG